MLSVSITRVLDRFTLAAQFSVPAKGIIGLFGDSGSGKTSILRIISGLQRCPGAQVQLGTEVWQNAVNWVSPERRGVGMVFQEGALCPHLNVRQNLDFAARRAPPNRSPRPIQVDAVIDMLELAPLLGRKTQNLSGCERQRVAIGRALLSQPQLLLLDEPVSALDHGTRDEILAALERLSAALDLPMLYVSHNLAEMASITDHLVLLSQGRVAGSGATAQMLTDLSLPLAARPDALSVLGARVSGYDAGNGSTRLLIDGHEWKIPGRLGKDRADCRVRVMASDVGLARDVPGATTILNTPPARILTASAMPQSEQVNVLMRLGADDNGQYLLARVSRESWQNLQFQPGETVHLLIKGVGLVDAN